MSKLLEVIKRHKKGGNNGIYSVCSAHPLVLEAALLHALENNSLLLIEATSNQVDHFGGYTGMTPQDFHNFVLKLAEKTNFPVQNLILGGDHLGPNRWQNQPSDIAMKNAENLIEAYVKAGFEKIHLDCSMSCQDDPIPLSDEIIAERTARLAVIAEKTADENDFTNKLVYVIGTEVPVPGGETEEIHELKVTSPEAARATIAAHQQAFNKAGISHIWPRVIGLVVQPGVEFDHTKVIDFIPAQAISLSQIIDKHEHLVFEAHSTDYQTPLAYRDLVRSHFVILKVGPALTFALREAYYGLCNIENEILSADQRSLLREVLEQQMLFNPNHWKKYYQGSKQELYFARHYSFSDRIRYYWSNPTVQQAVEKLFENFNNIDIPLPLLSQYFPQQYIKVRNGEIKSNAKALIIDKIQDVLRPYATASFFNLQ